ncbi:DUF2252 domain-containing protein ['Paenibacillus yunnanensis' Narsing Rao et al. 2020]|uniref:DUF2252 domain-containing protein n=1 Tax=Paenibacillus tengchongensis TaxID=2608684 RepID=UPI00124C78A3|nr:DUF2252 family protein [Paenibacillus tengchongensis]
MINPSITEGVIRTRTKLRQDLLISILDEFDEHIMGLDPHSRAGKYRKMAQSAFSFYRGSAYLFYFDATRQYFPYHTSGERPTWIQGDLHFENFGAFRSEDGEIVYDVNDFDEGYVGSYLYDLLRMSVSIALVGRQLGLDTDGQLGSIGEYIQAYHRQIRRFAQGKDDPEKFLMNQRQAKGPVRKLLRKLERRRQGHFLEKVTAQMQTGRVFLENTELAIPELAEQEQLEQAWSFYLDTILAPKENKDHYRIKDIAVKHGSGTASIGLDRFYVLIEGDAGAEELDDTVLEAKEVRVPVPAYFLPYSESFWSFFAHQGKRVAATQQAMHHKADPYLGFLTLEGRYFYVRERSPYKKRLKLQDISDREDMERVLESMGRLTAKMHARADADVNKGILAYHSEKEIAAAMGPDADAFAKYIAEWAYSYANQVEKDYAMFTEWVQERFGVGLPEVPVEDTAVHDALAQEELVQEELVDEEAASGPLVTEDAVPEADGERELIRDEAAAAVETAAQDHPVQDGAAGIPPVEDVRGAERPDESELVRNESVEESQIEEPPAKPKPARKPRARKASPQNPPEATAPVDLPADDTLRKNSGESHNL